MSADLREALAALELTIATDPRDWAATRRDAWCYGVVCGWDDAIPEIAARYPSLDLRRMARFHAAIKKARK